MLRNKYGRPLLLAGSIFAFATIAAGPAQARRIFCYFDQGQRYCFAKPLHFRRRLDGAAMPQSRSPGQPNYYVPDYYHRDRYQAPDTMSGQDDQDLRQRLERAERKLDEICFKDQQVGMRIVVPCNDSE